MTDEPRIIRLFDRQPYDPETAAPPEGQPRKPKVDPDTIQTLKMALDMARAGDVTGCVVILGLNLSEHDPDVVTDATSLVSFNIADDMTLFLGALEQAKDTIFELHADLYEENE